jgi:hypothetical protein
MSIHYIGVQRLHRLLPSDLKRIALALEHAGADDTATVLLGVFAEYVLQFDNPHPTQIDDIERIALQLKSTGILKHSYPDGFLVHLHQRKAPTKTLAAIAEAWGVELERPPPAPPDSPFTALSRAGSKKRAN